MSQKRLFSPTSAQRDVQEMACASVEGESDSWSGHLVNSKQHGSSGKGRPGGTLCHPICLLNSTSVNYIYRSTETGNVTKPQTHRTCSNKAMPNIFRAIMNYLGHVYTIPERYYIFEMTETPTGRSEIYPLH